MSKSISRRRLLSIVIPVFNEMGTIKKVLKDIDKVKLFSVDKEVIVVDDGSTDGTTDFLVSDSKHSGKYLLILNDRNYGKGYSIKQGILKSIGDYVVIQDADLEYDPRDLNKMLTLFFEKNADAVYGSRFVGGDARSVIPSSSYYANKFLTFLSNIFSGLSLTDMETCYKVIKGDIAREIAIKLSAKRFGFEPEITAKLAKRKLTIYEIGISYYARKKGEGKKIKAVDGLKAIWEIIRYNIFPD